MSFIYQLFFEVFVLFYMILNPLFRNPRFATYLAILILFATFAWFNFKWIRKTWRQKALRGKWQFVAAVFLEIYFIAFLIWYIFLYFHTYKT